MELEIIFLNGNDKISNTKLANMPGDRFKGRLTNTGDPQDLTIAQVQALIGSGGDGGHSFASNGYQKFTWGLILQWGRSGTLAPDGGAWVTFPIAFPSACLQVMGCHDRDVYGVDSWPDDSIIVGSISTTRCRISNPCQHRSSRGRWIAVGY